MGLGGGGGGGRELILDISPIKFSNLYPLKLKISGIFLILYTKIVVMLLSVTDKIIYLSILFWPL